MSMIPKHFLDDLGFHCVVQPCAGSMGIDISDLIRVQPGLLEGNLDGSDRADDRRLRDVTGVRRQTVPGYLGVNLGATFSGVFQFLQNENPRPFAHDQTLAVG